MVFLVTVTPTSMKTPNLVFSLESLLNTNKVGCLANGNSRIFSRHLATLDHKLNIEKGIPRKHDGLSVSFILKSLYGVA